MSAYTATRLGRLGAAREQLRGRLAMEGGGPPNAIAKKATLVLGVGIATAVVRYLIQVLFARRGGAVEFGRYSFAFGWTQVLVIPATLGLSLSVLRFVPQYFEEGRWDLLRGLIRRGSQLTLLGGLLFSAAGAGLVLLLANGSSQGSLLLGMALISLVALVTVLRETTRGTHRVVLAYSVGELLPMGLILAAAVALPAATGHVTAEGMLLATGAGFALALGVQWVVLRRAAPRAFAPAVRPEFEMRTWLMLSAPLWLISLFTLMINQADLLVLGLVKSPHEVGVYAAGSKTAWLVSFVLTAVSAVLAPVFVRHHTAGDMPSLRATMRFGTRLIFWPSLVLAAILFAWPDLILAAFGAEFDGAVTVVRILAVGQLVNALTGPAGYLLLLTGSQRTVAWTYGSAAAAQIVALIVVVPKFGIDGAACVTAATIIVSNSLLYVFAHRRLNRDQALGEKG
jgi:O-antigen/teichoic acid export membrane protein